METIEIIWICPDCQSKNLDDFIQTAEPLCDNCGDTYQWGDILSLEEMEKNNKILADQEEST